MLERAERGDLKVLLRSFPSGGGVSLFFFLSFEKGPLVQGGGLEDSRAAISRLQQHVKCQRFVRW